MSFREKSAWIILVTLIVITSAYMTHMQQPWTLAPDPSPFMFYTLVHAVILYVIVVTVAHIVIGVRAPREARAPKDERERLISLRATAVSAYVYAILSMASIFTIHFGANQFGIGYLVLLSFVVAEVVNYAVRIYYYRRG